MLPDVDRCLVMGVVNVTPDSFSDGGRWFDAGAAVRARARRWSRRGADLVDVGGESTRPGALRVDAAEELPAWCRSSRAPGRRGRRRLGRHDVGRDRRARRRGRARPSSTTSRAAAPTPTWSPLAAGRASPFVVMHWRGHSDTMQQHTDYDDLVDDVVAELRRSGRRRRRERASTPERIVVDPGLGLLQDAATRTGPCWRTSTRSSRWATRCCVAASRKGFLGELLADEDGARGRSTSATTPRRDHHARGRCRRVVRPRARRRAERRRRARRRAAGARSEPRGDVLAAHRAFYDAIETGDVDLMASLWVDDVDTIVRAPRGRRCAAPGAILRSWTVLMADVGYIQFFLTDVEVTLLPATRPDHRGRRVHREHPVRGGGRRSTCLRGRPRCRTSILVRDAATDGVSGRATPRR